LDQECKFLIKSQEVQHFEEGEEKDDLQIDDLPEAIIRECVPLGHFNEEECEEAADLYLICNVPGIFQEIIGYSACLQDLGNF
jgi:hypothetical protein